MMFSARRRPAYPQRKRSGFSRVRGSAGAILIMSKECVNVIGGGLAGLSAAVALAEAGVRVRLFEKRPYLGGRATSYLLPDGSHVDNCQHVTLGCCTNLADFYRRVGSADRIRYYDRLYFADARGRRYSIGSFLFSPPFHMTLSFLRFSALSWADKSGIAPRHAGDCAFRRASARRRGKFHARLASSHGPDGRRPSSDSGASCWSARSMKNWRAPMRTTASMFSGKRSSPIAKDFRVGIPSVPLADLYEGCRAGHRKARRGSSPSRHAARFSHGWPKRIRSLVFDDGPEIDADTFVFSPSRKPRCSSFSVATLADSDPLFAGLRHLRDSPITGIHLWFDRPVMKEPFLTLLDHTVQWIFNKTLLYASGQHANQIRYSSGHRESTSSRGRRFRPRRAHGNRRSVLATGGQRVL